MILLVSMLQRTSTIALSSTRKERSWQMYLPLPITASVLRRFFQESKAVPKVKAK